VGAGDAFTAGFAYCFLRGMSLAEACKFGNILGAIVSTKKGGTSPITKDEIDSFKKKILSVFTMMKLIKFFNFNKLKPIDWRDDHDMETRSSYS